MRTVENSKPIVVNITCCHGHRVNPKTASTFGFFYQPNTHFPIGSPSVYKKLQPGEFHIYLSTDFESTIKLTPIGLDTQSTASVFAPHTHTDFSPVHTECIATVI